MFFLHCQHIIKLKNIKKTFLLCFSKEVKYHKHYNICVDSSFFSLFQFVEVVLQMFTLPFFPGCLDSPVTISVYFLKILKLLLLYWGGGGRQRERDRENLKQTLR